MNRILHQAGRVLLMGACLILLSGCSRVELKQQVVETELGADLFANPRLYVKEGQSIDADKADVYAVSPGIMKTKNRFVTNGGQYLQIGEYDFMLEYNGREYPFTVKVKDTKAPVCTYSPSVLSVSPGSAVDWEKVFEAKDLSGVYYECEGLDTSVLGTSDVKVRIADRFGNAAEKIVTVTVQ